MQHEPTRRLAAARIDPPPLLMLVSRNGHDDRLFRIAAAVERLLAG